MLYAVLSDIHGNYDALKAVEKDARQMAKKEKRQLAYICLGDVVDYGPEPNDCVEWVTENVSTDLFVRGNHDQDVATEFGEPPTTINKDYWPITLWTRSVLKPTNRQFLIDQSISQKKSPSSLPQFTLFHGGVSRVDDRLDTERLAKQMSRKIDTPYALFGHTHYQGGFWEKHEFNGTLRHDFMHFTYYREDGQLLNPTQWATIPLGEWHDLPADNHSRTLLNPGSVGQPRRHSVQKAIGQHRTDHDPRAAYLLLSAEGNGSWKYQFRRVAYDYEKTLQKLRKLKFPPAQEGNWGYEASIDLDRPHKAADPRYQQLQEIMDNIHAKLKDLINNTLIPTLKDGH